MAAFESKEDAHISLQSNEIKIFLQVKTFKKTAWFFMPPLSGGGLDLGSDNSGCARLGGFGTSTNRHGFFSGGLCNLYLWAQHWWSLMEPTCTWEEGGECDDRPRGCVVIDVGARRSGLDWTGLLEQ